MLRRFFGRWQTSFRFRLVISTTLAIAITVALYSGFQYIHHTQLAETAQRAQAERLASLMAESLAQPMYDLNTVAINSAVNALKAHADIRWVRIKDDEGESLIDTSSGQKENEILLKTRRIIEYKGENRIIPVGNIELAFSRKTLDSELSTGFFEILLGGILVTVGAVIAALRAFRVVTKPLATITRSLDQLSSDQTSIALPDMLREDEFGRMAIAVSRFRDALVERQHADQQIRASEKRFRDFSMSSADWFWETDEKMRVSYLSENIGETFGSASDSIRNHSLREIVTYDTQNPASLWEQHLAKFDHHRPFRNLEFQIQKPGGEIAWLSISGIPHTYAQGVFAGYRGIGQDITARKRAEELAHKLSLAVEQSPNTVMITNADGDIEYVNKSFTRVTGYRQDEVLGCNPRLLKSDDTPKETFSSLWQSLSKGEVWQGELTNRRKDGSCYIASGIFAPLRQIDGSISHYLSICADVTEKKRVENELADYRLRLESMVEERTRQLAEAKETAEAANQAKSAFVANMSHEIRTPLNAVLGLAKIIARENHGRRSEETARRITEAGEHLLGVINDILDYSKIEAGKLLIETRPFSLAASISNAIGLVTEQAWTKGLSLRTELAADVPQWVSGDRLRFEQILINLLANAVKFTEQGEIALTLLREGEMIVVRISDTGIGMSSEQAASLFQPFKQADTSTTRKYGGSGLGLAISRNLARQMGGDITLESHVGKGSVFALSLPFKESTPEIESNRLPGYGRRLEGVRILAAEDVELNRIVLEDMLSQEGARTLFAEHGQQALDLIKDKGLNSFDIVLTDIQMPVMDGYELSRHIHALNPDFPVIGLTARAMPEEHERCLAAGMLAHVTKPIDDGELSATILRHTRTGPVIPLCPEPEHEPMNGGSSVETGSLIDWGALSTRYQGRETFSEKLLHILIQTHGKTPERLREAIQADDRNSLKSIAHTLQGIAGNIEAPSVRELALHLETSLTTEAQDYQEATHKLANTLEMLIKMLRERPGYHTSSPESPA